MGTALSGKNVAVTFDGLPAKILFDNDTQINVVVPSGLGGKSSAQLSVVVDGASSVTKPVVLAGFSPGIFGNGILNEDGQANSTSHPAQVASILQIYAT